MAENEFFKVPPDDLGCLDLCFQAILGSFGGCFDHLCVPKPLIVELFWDQKGMRSEPRMRFPNDAPEPRAPVLQPFWAVLTLLYIRKPCRMGQKWLDLSHNDLERGKLNCDQLSDRKIGRMVWCLV